MKFIFSIFLFLFTSYLTIAQPQLDLQATAKKLIQEGDYENATLVLNKILSQEPNNISVQKDYALVFYYKKDYKKSIDICKKILKDTTADSQAYQLLAMNDKAIGLTKDLEKICKDAIIKFPDNGFFYNEIGEYFYLQNNLDSAIVYWQKGIKQSPNFPGNYYNASMFFSRNARPFIAIIYGETFINLECYTTRTAEVKELIINAYKNILQEQGMQVIPKSNFEKKFIETLGNNNEAVTASSLTAIRTKFILQWFFEKNNLQFPCNILQHQQYLVQEGLFEAYNQWLFGLVINPIQYKVWADTHKKEADAFKQFQQSRFFKILTPDNF